MMAHECLAHRRVAQQKRPKSFRKHIFGAHVVPNLAAHFIFFIARQGHRSKIAIGDVFNLVVVVEHHFAMAGNAEILPQHVTGEYIRRHQVFDGVPVFDHAPLDLVPCPRSQRLAVTAGLFGVKRCAPRIKGFLQIDIERNHSALNVNMFDDGFHLAIGIPVTDLQLTGRKFFQLVDQLILKTAERKSHLAVFQRIGHPTHPVVLFDQQVFALDLLARGVFLWRIKILDDLENVREGRQIKHQHHHALDAWRNSKLVT